MRDTLCTQEQALNHTHIYIMIMPDHCMPLTMVQLRCLQMQMRSALHILSLCGPSKRHQQGGKMRSLGNRRKGCTQFHAVGRTSLYRHAAVGMRCITQLPNMRCYCLLRDCAMQQVCWHKPASMRIYGSCSLATGIIL